MYGRWNQVRLCLEAHLQDDIKCAEWCSSMGILRAMPRCSLHNQDRTLARRNRSDNIDRDQVFWRCSKCKDQISVRQGTIFHHAKLSLGRALLLSMCFAQGLSIEDARRALLWSADALPVAASTAVRWYDQLRSRIAKHISTQPPIGGNGMIVQIDEALIGRRKYNRGRVV